MRFATSQSQQLLTKSKSLHHTLKDPMKMVKKRLDDHVFAIKNQIQQLNDQCTPFGGVRNLFIQMEKHPLEKQELQQFERSYKSRNFSLPKLTRLTLSKPQPKQKTSKQKKSLEHNKWFIAPEQRFKHSHKQTVYDWNKNHFYLNIVKKRGIVNTDQQIVGLVKATKQKIGRKPLFCQYTTLSPKK